MGSINANHTDTTRLYLSGFELKTDYIMYLVDIKSMHQYVIKRLI